MTEIDHQRHRSPRLVPGALLLLAVAARGLAAAGLGVIPRDGIVYVETARSVAAGDILAAWQGVQHPLFPALAGLLGGSEAAATIVAIAAGSTGVLALLLIGRRIGLATAGAGAAVLYAVAPGMVRYQSAPLGESLFVPLALFAVERALAPNRRAAAVAGLLAAGAYLARPEGLLLPLVLAPALLIRRRPAAAGLFLLGFALLAGPYIGALSAEAGGLAVSRKKPVGRYLAAEEGFDRHMAEKMARIGGERPDAIAAAAETIRSLGEAGSWVLLLLAIPGAVLLLSCRERRAFALVLLALLAAALALSFRHLQLHGYLGRRHLVFAAALLLLPAARIFPLRRRAGVVALAVLAAALLALAVRPRDREKLPLKIAGREILAASGEGARIATWQTPRIPYYARGRDVKLVRLLPELRRGPVPPVRIRRLLAEQADWLALVPSRLKEETRLALFRAAAGLDSSETGSGEDRVILFSCQRP